MSHKKRFQNKHVLITGGARGIGFAIATHFAREDAQITIFDNHAENLEKAVEALNKQGDSVHGEQVDISDRKKVFEVVEKSDKRKSIDVLINNAGIAKETAFLEIDEVEWKRILDVNLTGMFHVAQAVCRHMAERGRGAVVNMASKNGLDGEVGYAHYNSSKGGVIMLTKTMALELADVGVRVNAVCPGYIQTPMSMEIDPPEFTEKFVERYIPVNHPGKVDDVAPAFLFLASDESRFTTGQILVIDGGQLAGQKPF